MRIGARRRATLHTLPESDDEALAAFQKIRNRSKPTKPDLRIA